MDKSQEMPDKSSISSCLINLTLPRRMKSKFPCSYLVLIPSLTWAGGGEEIGAGGEGVATFLVNTHYAVVFTPFNTIFPQ